VGRLAVVTHRQMSAAGRHGQSICFLRLKIHVDGRSTAELHQDCGTLAAIDAFSDPMMVSDANVGRGLETVIPLSRTVAERQGR
jgi:hypothetical protein